MSANERGPAMCAGARRELRGRQHARLSRNVEVPPDYVQNERADMQDHTPNMLPGCSCHCHPVPCPFAAEHLQPTIAASDTREDVPRSMQCIHDNKSLCSIAYVQSWRCCLGLFAVHADVARTLLERCLDCDRCK